MSSGAAPPPSEKDRFDADLAKGRVLLKGNTLVWRMCACKSTPLPISYALSCAALIIQRRETNTPHT